MHITHIAMTVCISLTGHGAMVDNYKLLFLLFIFSSLSATQSLLSDEIKKIIPEESLSSMNLFGCYTLTLIFVIGWGRTVRKFGEHSQISDTALLASITKQKTLPLGHQAQAP